MKRPGGSGCLGLTILVLLGTMALSAPFLAPYDPRAFSGRPLERPGPAHLLGTNDVGQDILSELLYGARVSLLVAIGAGVGATTLGTLIGGMAGYVGGRSDEFLMRVVDGMMSLPRLPLFILFSVFLGAGLIPIIVVISLLSWPMTARLIRVQVQRLRQRDYVRMACQFGGGSWYVLTRHVLPAVAPLIGHSVVVLAGHAVTMEAGLAFLGLGDPMAKSWGLMMRFALNFPGIFLTDRWIWWLLPPSLCVTSLILALAFIGMEMEQQLNPRLARRWR